MSTPVTQGDPSRPVTQGDPSRPFPRDPHPPAPDAARKTGLAARSGFFARSRPPIIVIGMHRSGTTMVVDGLREMGAFMGWDLQGDLEALYFLRRNNRLLRLCNGSWEYPRAAEALLGHEPVRAAVAEKLARDLSSRSFLGFLGPLRWLRVRAAGQMDFPWGWKDPRNTCFLPLWLDLFPEARVIHIYRNGIDVANSLRRRNSAWESDGMTRSGAHGIGKALGTFRRKLDPTSLFNPKLALHQLFDPMRSYARLVCNQSTVLDFGFDLWSQYVNRAFETTSGLGDRVLHVKYEEFLDDPGRHAVRLAEFGGLDPDRARQWAAKVNPGRRYAFLGSGELCAFYERVKSNGWMETLGYGRLT